MPIFEVVSIQKDLHAAVHILIKGLDGAFCHINLQAMLSCVFVAREFKFELWYCVSHSTYSLEHLMKHILNWWELISNNVPQKAISYILGQVQLIDKALHSQMTAPKGKMENLYV
nr:hypothetical protein CFP56_03421 [Quercus suber]